MSTSEQPEPQLPSAVGFVPTENSPAVSDRNYQTASPTAKNAKSLFIAGTCLALIFAFISLFWLAGALTPLIGLTGSTILMLLWSIVNFNIAKERLGSSNISPLRALAMSVLVNQFVVAHVLLLANSIIFELAMPVLRTLRPADIVLSFAELMGYVIICLLIGLSACLTVLWHAEFSKKVYGDGSSKNTRAGAAIGIIFAMVSVWLAANMATSTMYIWGPFLTTVCYVPVFLIARQSLDNGQAALATTDGVSRKSRLTVEWLLLSTYVISLFLSASSLGLTGVIPILFFGLHVMIWLIYLISETRSAYRK